MDIWMALTYLLAGGGQRPAGTRRAQIITAESSGTFARSFPPTSHVLLLMMMTRSDFASSGWLLSSSCWHHQRAPLPLSGQLGQPAGRSASHQVVIDPLVQS